ncbi:MAG: hypothetical protein ACM3KR_08245 [Deltaproteobacteria bacterium]
MGFLRNIGGSFIRAMSSPDTGANQNGGSSYDNNNNKKEELVSNCMDCSIKTYNYSHQVPCYACKKNDCIERGRKQNCIPKDSYICVHYRGVIESRTTGMYAATARCPYGKK